MTIKQQLTKYAKECLNGTRIACIKIKWAAQRFLDDVEKEKIKNTLSEPFLYYWDETEAQKIVEWFALLKHSKGALAGQFIRLTVEQKFFVCQLYGWRQDVTGYKRFSRSFMEVARKNAKSQLEAGIALYEISVESTRWGEIYEAYTAGTKREQSKIVFDEANNLLKGSPLRKKFTITRNAITHKKTGSFIKTLSKEDGKSGDGTNPALLILDEYHQHPNTDLYDLGLGGNTKQSLLMIITTAGMDLNSPCYQQEYKYTSDILNPDKTEVYNDSYLVIIFEADEGDDIADRSTWIKANPIRMSYAEGEQKIREAYEVAIAIPEKMIAFLTKMLNIWVQAKENSYMDMARWNACVAKDLPFDITGSPVYVGFDMSAKIDLTSVAFIIPYQDEEGTVKYLCFSHSFIPNRAKLIERKMKDKAAYDAWEQSGYITITDSEIVDQNVVMNYVTEFINKYKLKVQCLCFDPNNAAKLMMDLSSDYVVEEVYQSHKSLNEATAGFREQVYEGNVVVMPNPVLNFAMANAVLKYYNGLIKIDKDAARKRIDPVDALLCAFKLAYYHEFANYSYVDAWLDEV